MKVKLYTRKIWKYGAKALFLHRIFMNLNHTLK